MIVASEESGCIISMRLSCFFASLRTVFRHLGLFQLALEFVDLLGPLVGIAQFLLQGMQLFAQEIFALGLAHLLLGIILDLGLDGRDLKFLGQQIADQLEPFYRIGLFKNRTAIRRSSGAGWSRPDRPAGPVPRCY